GKVVDVAKSSMVIELAGTEEKIEAFVELMRPYTIVELARTGVIAMARGMQNLKDRSAAPAGPKMRSRSLDAAPLAALPPSYRARSLGELNSRDQTWSPKALRVGFPFDPKRIPGPVGARVSPFRAGRGFFPFRAVPLLPNPLHGVLGRPLPRFDHLARQL